MSSLKANLRRTVSGVLLLDKAVGISSNGALQQVRRLYNANKAGHTGVLDPLASGLLPICFGEATKFAQYLLDADKAYIATLKLGEATDTADAEGKIIKHCDYLPSYEQFQSSCEAFIGDIKQIPPMYSAIKYQGRSLYDYARSGIEIERKVRDVHIHNIQIVSFSLPEVVLKVECSKGTYIRTLAEDIANHSNTCAHLIGLRRTNTAGFDIKDAYRFDDLAKISINDMDKLLLPPDVLVSHLPEIHLNSSQIECLQRGQVVDLLDNCDIIENPRVYSDEGRFIGLGKLDGNRLRALRLMAYGSR